MRMWLRATPSSSGDRANYSHTRTLLGASYWYHLHHNSAWWYNAKLSGTVCVSNMYFNCHPIENSCRQFKEMYALEHWFVFYKKRRSRAMFVNSLSWTRTNVHQNQSSMKFNININHNYVCFCYRYIMVLNWEN